MSSLAVNSFTASGVVVKEELDEKPSLLPPVEAGAGDKEAKTASLDTLLQAGEADTGQLGHFVSVNQGFQVRKRRYFVGTDFHQLTL